MTRKAYNEQGIFNRLVQDTARRWGKAALLTPAQVAATKQAFPTDFYEPHLFVKVAVFLFTCFAVSGVSGLVFLVVEGGTSGSFSWEWRLLIGSLLSGLGSFFLLETLIKSNHLYRSGVDNALLYCGLSYAAAVLGSCYSLALPAADPEILLARGVLWLYLLPPLLVLLLAVIRYADPVLGAVSFLLYLGIVVTLLLPSGLGKALLPFGLMLASALAYQAVRLLARRPDYLYYRTCLRTVKALALASLYLAGNYLVVREVNAVLNNLPTSVQIGFAPLFYLFTAAIPLVYIALGLRRADRIFLLTGLLALAFSLYTYRFYRQLLPVEWALTLGGAFLIVLSGAALRYLRPHRHGLTSEPADSPGFNFLQVESLVTAHVTENTLDAPEPGFEFGGGASGGGGAEGKW